MKPKKQNKREFSEFIKTCLSDLNGKPLEFVSHTIEIQHKQDISNKILLMLELVFGFVLLIAIFKNIGFLAH